MRGGDRGDPDRPHRRGQAISQTLELRAADRNRPDPSASGQRTQHRLNRGGGPPANHALHIIAVTRAQHNPATKATLLLAKRPKAKPRRARCAASSATSRAASTTSSPNLPPTNSKPPSPSQSPSASCPRSPSVPARSETSSRSACAQPDGLHHLNRSDQQPISAVLRRAGVRGEHPPPELPAANSRYHGPIPPSADANDAS